MVMDSNKAILIASTHLEYQNGCHRNEMKFSLIVAHRKPTVLILASIIAGSRNPIWIVMIILALLA
jgi:hypothetical protein